MDGASYSRQAKHICLQMLLRRRSMRINDLAVPLGPELPGFPRKISVLEDFFEFEGYLKET
eukprot:6037854-Amphidinium_carterae.1